MILAQGQIKAKLNTIFVVTHGKYLYYLVIGLGNWKHSQTFF
jgi:hypothetical protein